MKRAFLCLIAFASLLESRIDIHLNAPSYHESCITTKKGGSITTKNFFLSAETITYSNKETEELHAEKKVLMRIGHKYILADEVHYNLTKKEGSAKNAIVLFEGVYIGAKSVQLYSDNTIEARDIWASTSDYNPPEWSANAKNLKINDRARAEAEKVTFLLGSIPVFWLPSYATSLKIDPLSPSPLIRYWVLWESGQGPLAIMRYRVWEKDQLKVFLRLEARLRNRKFGPGGALEIDWASKDQKQLLKSRNFYAYDTFYNDPNPNRQRNRFRIQGEFNGSTLDEHIEIFTRWDKLSDRFMRSEFPTQLFEITTLERTEAFVKARYNPVFASLYGRPRINDFRGFKQELPTFKLAFQPLQIGSFVLNSYMNFSYLDYVYAKELENDVQNFYSGRLEWKESLYRPIHTSLLSIVPEAGFLGLFYTNSPQNKNAYQAIAFYDVPLQTLLRGTYTNVVHEIEPYIRFFGYTKPSTPVDQVYIFSADDGYTTLNQVTLGLKNDFFLSSFSSITPKVRADFRMVGFFNSSTFSNRFPKGYADVFWNFPKLSFFAKIGYNFQADAFDHTNFGVKWTLNSDAAFSFEVWKRSKYDFRKNEYTNYILDNTRTINQMLNTPLSDRRTLLLTKFQIRLGPLWTMQFRNHVGIRRSEPIYSETQINLFTIISNTWKLRLSYTRVVNNNQFSFGFTLV